MSFFKKTQKREPEVGMGSENLADLRQAIETALLPGHARKAAFKELERLEKTDPAVAEFSIGVTYLDFILTLPWSSVSNDNLDLGRAERILDEEHFALAAVKDRILEHLAASIMSRSVCPRVLVVDDEAISRDNIAHILRKENYDVLTAGTGLEALDLLNADADFDLVITDLKMEKLDGLQLLEHFRVTSANTQFIIITGYATVDTAVDALKKGAINYLSKPLNLGQLRKAVAEALSKRSQAHLPQGQVLCFAGPPGIGKTSIGRSIANALERTFIRFSVAGLRDEAELRGHRRTYVGALPGRIIQEIRRAGVKNPVFMMDEIDKIGQDFRGDPAAVLLEVLDPEQNGRFLDYYVDLPFDLSQIMFLTTANLVERLPSPLLDRMEIVPFSSYTLAEKKGIANGYLIPRQLKAHGFSSDKLHFSDEALEAIIQGYTREAGVRNLEREIAGICRKISRRMLQKTGDIPRAIDRLWVQQIAGPVRFHCEAAEAKALAGVTTGLVWTEFGGQIIFIESAIMNGRQNLILTGSLGEILKESAQTALSFVRSRIELFGIKPDFFENRDIHIHIPAGAIPKDGASAGLTIVMALISLLTRRAARRDVALSGEITLSGQILPVSGLREKILAAQQAGVRKVLFPQRNQVDIDVLDADVRLAVEVVLIDSVETAIQHTLV